MMIFDRFGENLNNNSFQLWSSIRSSLLSTSVTSIEFNGHILRVLYLTSELRYNLSIGRCASLHIDSAGALAVLVSAFVAASNWRNGEVRYPGNIDW